jgi:hypothetical protein
MEPEPKPAPEVDSPPDPQAIDDALRIVATVKDLIDKGELEQLCCYIGRRDGTYITLQNRNNGRHEDAGRMLEFAIRRLGFVQREEVKDIVDQ